MTETPPPEQSGRKRTRERSPAKLHGEPSIPSIATRGSWDKNPVGAWLVLGTHALDEGWPTWAAFNPPGALSNQLLIPSSPSSPPSPSAMDNDR
eukprot:CAMPEP_0173437338 /NCGR_PEP_ID=MMETSP1357-20121228/17974_1 /TAXON_ID=77926 /ORGANISM="Hemiselmis rufescens, Strain PCC563" /LENGTH=93 /DNA_ID=CAMNT_0014402513 /DNA_START=366 /DNA_END=648 /DNA_ORIENTATION=+